MSLRTTVLLASALVTAGGSVQAASKESPMPGCSARLRGQFWPREANQDPGLLMKLARLGELRMCTRGTWRYRWESPTVHVNQLAKSGDAKPRGADTAALSTAGTE